MWYSDPFIALPVIMFSVAIGSFIIMAILAYFRYGILARIFAAIFAAFISASAFGLTFGYYLRHTEEVNKWIGIISL